MSECIEHGHKYRGVVMKTRFIAALCAVGIALGSATGASADTLNDSDLAPGFPGAANAINLVTNSISGTTIVTNNSQSSYNTGYFGDPKLIMNVCYRKHRFTYTRPGSTEATSQATLTGCGLYISFAIIYKQWNPGTVKSNTRFCGQSTNTLTGGSGSANSWSDRTCVTAKYTG
jgi:hypothetical protein